MWQVLVQYIKMHFFKKKNIKPKKAGGSTAYLRRALTVRLDTAIALYMPTTSNLH